MSAIIKYNHAKQALGEACQWWALHGKEYFGGTCGKGNEYGHFASGATMVNGLTIYHQEYDGAANYHDCPKSLSAAIGEVLKRTTAGHEVIRLAIQRMSDATKQAAQGAAKEHKAMMDAAGITEEAQP